MPTNVSNRLVCRIDVYTSVHANLLMFAFLLESKLTPTYMENT